MSARATFQAHGSLIFLGGLTVFSPLIEGGTTHLPVLIVRLVLLATLTTWILISMKSGGITVFRSRLFLPIAVFVGWAALAVVRSPYTAASLQWLISLFSYAAMLFLVMHLVESTRQVRWLVAVILGMGLFEAAVGTYQYLWLDRPRATGTFFNPNFFATYEMAIFAVLFGLACFSQREKALRWEKPILYSAAGVIGLAFVLAQSRGALLAFVVAVTFIGLYRFGKAFLAILVLGLLLFATIPNPLQQRILTIGSQDPYAFTRLDIWKNSLQRIADDPWGEGLGMYKYTSFRYRFPIEGAIVQYGKRAESAHNEYLQMSVELGVVGLALFLTGVVLLAREIREILKGPLEPWERGLVTGLTGGILGFLVHGAVDSVFHEPALVLLLLLFAGLIVVLKRLKGPAAASVRVVSFPYSATRAALVGGLATLLALLIIRPAAAWYAFEKGESEMSAGRIEKGLRSFEWATLIDPGSSAYHDRVAHTQVRLFQHSGDVRWIQSAISELQVGLELNPLDSRLAHRLGMLHLLLAQRANPGPERAAMMAQAATYYEKAVRLDPYSPFNYVELGKLRWEQGRMEEAAVWFRRAIRYEPNFLPARVHLTELSLKTGQKETAALEYREIIKIQERYQGWTLNSLERQYLAVEHERLHRALAAVDAS